MQKERILTRSFCFSFAAVFSSTMIFYILITTASESAVRYGADASISGLVSGIYVIGILITRFLFSRILARVGWKRTRFFGQTLQLLACLLYFGVHDLPTLIAARFVHGLCFGVSSLTNLTLGMHQIPKSRYGEGNGWLMTAITLSIGLGPFLAGALYDRFGATGCYCAVVAFAAVSFACIAPVPLPPDPAPVPKAQRETGLNSLIEVRALPVTFCVMLATMAYSAILSFLRLYGQAISMERSVSRFFIVYAAALLLSRPLAGRLQDRRGDGVVVYPCILIQVLSLLLLAYWPTRAGIALAAVCCAGGYGTLSSCISAIASRNALGARKAFAVATYWICCDFGSGFGPFLLGAVQDALGFRGMYAAAAAVSLAIIPLYRILCDRPARLKN